MKNIMAGLQLWVLGLDISSVCHSQLDSEFMNNKLLDFQTDYTKIF